MAQIFSSNQVSQVLVAESRSTDALTSASSLGAIKADKTVDNKYIYFTHMGKGGITRSDLIEVASIMSAKAVKAVKMLRNLKYSLIQLGSEALSSGNPKAGSYILNFEFMNPIGMSPDNKYFKHAAVNMAAGSTTSAFYGKLAKSIAQNMAREYVKLITPAAFYPEAYVKSTGATAGKLYIVNGVVYLCKTNVDANTDFNPNASNWLAISMITPVEYNASTTTCAVGDVVAHNGIVYVCKTAVSEAADWADAKFVAMYQPIMANTDVTTLSNITGVLVMEEAQTDWRLGHIQDKALVWNTSFSPLTVDGTDYLWGTETLIKGAPVVNSKKAAEFEYFAMGERADQYRGAGWPNNIDTEYMVDSTYSKGYDMICIHFAYTGSNHAVQKSEKDLFILVKTDKAVGVNELGTVAGQIVTQVNGLISGVTIIS